MFRARIVIVLILIITFPFALAFLLFLGLLPYKAKPLSDFDFFLLRVLLVISAIRVSSSSLVFLFLVFDRYCLVYIRYTYNTLAINIVIY
jgi:hypothetical protein